MWDQSRRYCSARPRDPNDPTDEDCYVHGTSNSGQSDVQGISPYIVRIRHPNQIQTVYVLLLFPLSLSPDFP